MTPSEWEAGSRTVAIVDDDPVVGHALARLGRAQRVVVQIVQVASGKTCLITFKVSRKALAGV